MLSTDSSAQVPGSRYRPAGGEGKLVIGNGIAQYPLRQLSGSRFQYALAQSVTGAFQLSPCQRLPEICGRLNEIEEQIANMVPTTIEDCLAQLRLLKYRRACVPDELDQKLVDNMLAGLETIPAGG